MQLDLILSTNKENSCLYHLSYSKPFCSWKDTKSSHNY